MSFDKLGDHIWIHVLKFLTPPLPKPLSGLTKQEAYEESDDVIAQLPDAGAPGVTTRGDIRAPELATLMRVSIAFNTLASVPLYKTIITDQLGSLLNYRGGPPAHRDIKSKMQLFHHTASIHLEYTQKGLAGPGAYDPSYERLLKQAHTWALIGRTEHETTMYLAMQEVEYLYRSAFTTTLIDHYTTHFPALKRLTVGAIFGGQDVVWMKARVMGWNLGAISNNWGAMPKEKGLSGPLDACQNDMIALFSKSPITHFCQRGHAGPLSLPQAFHWVDKTSHVLRPTTPLFNFHYNAHDVFTVIPAAVACPNRWLLDQVTVTNKVSDLFDIIIGSFTRVNNERDRLWREVDPLDNPSNVKAKKATLDLAIYGNTVGLPAPSAPVDEEDEEVDERQAISMANEMFIQQRDRATGLKKGEVDDVAWRYHAQAPNCLACGWAYERGGE